MEFNLNNKGDDVGTSGNSRDFDLNVGFNSELHDPITEQSVGVRNEINENVGGGEQKVKFLFDLNVEFKEEGDDECLQTLKNNDFGRLQPDSFSDQRPNVVLPPSSASLDLTGVSISDVFHVYAFLRSFSAFLFLSPFELDDFVTCLKCNESTSLLDNIHVSLLRTLKNSFSRRKSDSLRCLNWDYLDLITWPIYLSEYLSLRGRENILSDYYEMPLSARVEILRDLCDDVAESKACRSEMDRRTSRKDDEVDGASTSCVTGSGSDDKNGVECRLCRMVGSLMCCDSCTAAYHARCVGVVDEQLPEGKWYCSECTIHMGKPWSKMAAGKCIRGAELLGTDSQGRRYQCCFGYLLVSECSDDGYSFWFYTRNDLPNLIEALEASPLQCTNIITAIKKQWGVTLGTITGPSDGPSKYGYESSDASRGTHTYVNSYQLARTAASFSAEQLLIRKNVSVKSLQLKIISDRSAEFSWSNLEKSSTKRQQNCGWCIYCKAPEYEKKCLFLMRANIPAVERFSSEALGFQTTKARKNHLTDVICHIICIEDHLKGLISGPWLSPNYSEVWRKCALEADVDIGLVKDLLLEVCI
ncbi:hypothetical protein CASFOL_035297 [Castilleja foliolosa]|uniref:Uncharacterized protein n=1 Tax=Castilleja foliolosa TaxID=1961234 RepID=A0ABD3BS74_9LAMI